MKLSVREFDARRLQNRLIVALIGMSNVGKTYWARKLKHLGFQHINCDDLIEEKLVHHLKKLDYSGVADVSRWMGQPYEARYAKNQREFMSIEQGVVERITTDAKNRTLKNSVIDTTGSVVHLSDAAKRSFHREAFVVYLETTPDMLHEMFASYIKNPKPVVFGKVFKRRKGETDHMALKRCYKKLLRTRSALYARLADVTIPYRSARRCKNETQFLNLIRASLGKVI